MKTIKIVFLITMILSLAACQKEINFKCLKTKGDQETRTLSFTDFTEITLDVPCELTLTQGNEFEVIIESTTNVIDRIDSDSRLSGNELDININGCTRLKKEDVIIHITLPILDKISVDGSSEVTSSNILSVGEEFEAKIDGSGSVTIEIDSFIGGKIAIDGSGSIDLTGTTCDVLTIQSDGSAEVDVSNIETKKVMIQSDGSGNINCQVTEEISIDLQGSGTIEAHGQVTRQDIKVDGSGKIFNFDLLADDTNIEIKGSAEIEVECINNLAVKIDGSGNVCYRGNPTIGTVIVDGSGTVTNCN